MKKLTLNKTWELCLEMWKWISRQCLNPHHKCIGALKQEWLSKHGFEDVEIQDDCFLCEYVTQKTGFRGMHNKETCGKYCPPTKYDPDFLCSYTAYVWNDKPRKFYKKLVELNKIRTGK